MNNRSIHVVRIEVVSKAPPGGRCEIYDRMFFEVVRACKNVMYSLIPVNLYKGDVSPPAVIVNGEELSPGDGILLTPEEIISALKRHGAQFRGESMISAKLGEIYKNLTGG